MEPYLKRFFYPAQRKIGKLMGEKRKEKLLRDLQLDFQSSKLWTRVFSLQSNVYLNCNAMPM